MTPVSSIQTVAKLATFLGDALKNVTSKANLANAFRRVDQVGGQAPGMPRLVRLHSHEEGRATLTFESGVDARFRQRQDSLAERAVARRPSSPQDGHASGNSMPPDHTNMVVQKATVLAEDYLRARATDAEPNWVTVGSRQVSSWPRARLIGQTSPRVSAVDFSLSSMAETSPSASQKHSTGLIRAFRGFIIGVKPQVSGGHTAQASQQGAAPSPGKDVQRHIADALRSLRGELASMVHLYGGSQRGAAARRLGNDVARALQENGREEALRIASQGIEAVRLASAKFIVKKIELPRDHQFPANSASHGRRDSDRSQVSSCSSSLPSVGSDIVFDDPYTAAPSGDGMTAVRGAPTSVAGPLSEVRENPARGTRKSLTNVDYVRQLGTTQKELFRIASKYPGTERGMTARDLHSATQRIFEVMDAKTAFSGANKLLPLIRTMSTSQGFG